MDMTPFRGRLYLFLILIISAAIRVWQITARSLWFDESFSWRLIQFPLPEILTRTAADVHPPLYYLLLNGWTTVFGGGALSVRLLSVTAALASIVVIYYLATSLFRSRRTGVLAAALLGLSGWHVFLSQETRMYTLAAWWALLSTYCLWRAVTASRQSVGWWVGYTLSAAALIYTHYYGFFTLAAHAVWIVSFVLATTRGRLGEIINWRLTWYALLGVTLTAILFLPWLPTFLEQRARVADSFWIPPIHNWSVPETVSRMIIPTVTGPRHDTWGQKIYTLLPLVVVGSLGLGLLIRRGQSAPARAAAWLVMLCAGMPFLLSVLLSTLSRSIYQDRYLIIAFPFLLLPLAAIVGQLRSAFTRRLLTVLLLVGAAGCTWRYWVQLDVSHKGGLQQAVAYAADHTQSDEPIIVGSPFIFFAVDHYVQEKYHDVPRPHFYTDAREVIHFAGGPILTPNDILRPTDVAASTAPSIWVIDTTGFGGALTQLSSAWHSVDQQKFPEVFNYQGEIIVTHYQR